MADIIYSWTRVSAEQAKAEFRGDGPRLILTPLYQGHNDLPEVSIVEIEGRQWLDLDSGWESSPPIPVDDMLWLLREAGYVIRD